MTSLVIEIPGLRTYNESNGAQGKWRMKHARRLAVHEAVHEALLGVDWSGWPKPTENDPWRVVLTRLGPREMDDDGVVSALKPCRDQFARFIGVDDKHRRIVQYAYEPHEQSKTFGVRIEVTRRQVEMFGKEAG